MNTYKLVKRLRCPDLESIENNIDKLLNIDRTHEQEKTLKRLLDLWDDVAYFKHL